MKAIVSKLSGECLLFCKKEEAEQLSTKFEDILVLPAKPCKCGKGWLVDRKTDNKLKRG